MMACGCAKCRDRRDRALATEFSLLIWGPTADMVIAYEREDLFYATRNRLYRLIREGYAVDMAGARAVAEAVFYELTSRSRRPESAWDG